MAKKKPKHTTPTFSDGAISKTAQQLADSLRGHLPDVTQTLADAIRDGERDFFRIAPDAAVRGNARHLVNLLQDEPPGAAEIVAEALIDGSTRDLWKHFGRHR